MLPDFIRFIGNDTLIGHNINEFDAAFLLANTTRLGIRRIGNKTIDTLPLDRALYPEEPKHRLVDIIRRFGIAQTESHRAADDALQTAQCYETMKAYMKANGIK